MGHRVLILATLAALAALAAPVRADPGRVVGKVTVTTKDGKPVTGANVIVYVVGYDEPPDKGPPIEVAQENRMFVPDLVAVTRGASVRFPNHDPILHNVFSQSAARPFDLGSFKKGDAKDKDFPKVGVVDVYCNIHPEMAATILVLPNRAHARVAADGTFHIDGVRPGHWQVFAYTRRAKRPVSAHVDVVAGQDAHVDLVLVRGPEHAHLNKYGEPYRAPGATYR
jgi:plastocyanin